MVITSRNNPFVKETATLKDKKGRRALGLFLVEGEKMCSELNRSSLIVERRILSESYRGEIKDNDVILSDSVFLSLSDEKSPQGIMCRVKIPHRELCAPSDVGLLLDGISDPANVGAILRTANAVGYKDIYLTDDSADPFSPKSVRASMSGIFFERLYFGSREELLKTLSNTPILIADMHGENVFKANVTGNFVLAIGNEGKGISDAVRKVSSRSIGIPMENTQESLNAAVAAGIAMYLLKREKFN